MALITDFLDSKGIYNNYSKEDQYKHILFRANKVVQSQELNNLQFSIKEDIASILSKKYSNLDIIEGGLLQFLENHVELSESQFYLEGTIIKVESKQILKSLILNDSIGIKIRLEEIDKSEDELLLDKNPSSRNPNAEGANRIKIYGTWETQSSISLSDLFYPIFIFEDSKIQNTSNISVLDKPEFLRKYDFNTNGNYVIDGFDIIYKGEESTNFIENGDFKKWNSTNFHKNPGGNSLEVIPNWWVYTDQTSVDITRQEFPLNQIEVPNNPVYFSRFSFDSLGGSFLPEISCRIKPVDVFSFKEIKVGYYFKANKNITLNFHLVQFFGTGGSTPIVKNVGSSSIGTTWSLVEFTVLIPSTQGKIITSNSYLAFVFKNAIAEAFDLDVAESYCKNLFLDKGDFYKFSVREGIASVNGSEIVINTNKDLKIPVGTDLTTIDGEPFEFIPSTTYQLRNTSARSITRIIGQKRVISENVVHGSFLGSSDVLSKTPVFSVESISQGATTYVQGIHFTLSGDSINWSLQGAEPAPGSTYQVTYRYIEYNIEHSYNPYSNTFTIQDSIINNTTFYVDYSVTIPRFDRVVLNKYGEVSSIQGNSNFDQIYSFISNERGLHLADVELLYKQIPKVHLVYNRPYKLSDINFLYNTVRDLSEAIKDLKLSTKSFNSLYTGGEESVEFSDSFNGRSKIFDEQNSICDIYKNKCTSKVDFETLEILHDKNTLPKEEILLEDTLKFKNDFFEFDVNLEEEDGLAYFKLNKKRISWLSDSSKKILFRDEDAIRDYQTFGKLSSELNESFSLDVQGYGYGSSEILEIVIDNDIHSHIQSQPNGEFLTTIQVLPGTLQSGKRKIEIKGLTSKKSFSDIIQISSVDSKSLINGYRTYPFKSSKKEDYSISNLSSNDYISNSTWIWKSNPCFQTISFDEDLILNSIELEIESSSDVYVSIGETTNEYPDPNKIIGYSYLKEVDIVQNASNKFYFESPIFIEANKTYFLTIANSNGSLKISTNNLKDNRSIRSKTLRTFYTSINNSILVKQNFLQVAIKFYQLDFTPDSFDINDITVERDLSTIQVEDLTDLSIITGILSVDSTSVSFKATLVDRSEESFILEPFSNIYFQKYTGDLKISVIFKSYKYNLSSWVDSSVLVCLGKLQEQSKYETNILDFVGNRITTAITLYSDGDSSIEPYFWNGSTYEALIEDLSREEDLGNNTKIVYYYKDLTSSILETKLKIDLISNQNGSRPVISNLRMWYNIPFGGAEYIQFTPSGDINVQNGKIVNLAPGVQSTDGVNLQQLNSLSSSLTQYVDNSINSLQLNINSYIENYVDSQISSDLNALSTSLQNDYNLKISQLSDSVNSRIDQEVQSLENQISSEIDQATITINQTTQTQIVQLQNDLTQSIQSQIDQAEIDILNSVNSSLTSQINQAVNLAIDASEITLLQEVDSRISTANATLQNTLEDYVDSQISSIQTLIQSNTINYILSSSSPTKILIIQNNSLIENHVIQSTSSLTFNLLNLSEFVSLKSSFNLDAFSYSFTITNLSNFSQTITSETVGDKIQIKTWDNQTVDSVDLGSKTSITFMFSFSDNTLYEI